MLELLLKLPIMILWVAFGLLIKLPTFLLGLIVVPFTYRYKNTDIKDIPKIFTPWVNPEDQLGGLPGFPDSLPNFWKKAHGVGFWSFVRYHSLRNPADGLRNYKWLNVIPVPSKLKYVTNKYMRHYEPWGLEDGKTAYYFCWQGFWLGFQVVHVWSRTRYLVIKLGFRIHPADTIEGTIDPKGTRANLGASLATKALLYRKWGS